MASKWPKAIRDPIHGIIRFQDNPCDRLLLNLINTKEFQRLRRIKQLGTSELVFPAANHSRFAHCIGVMNMARRMVEKVEQLKGSPFDEHVRITVLATALLHDVGHGPFSHVFEHITKDKHDPRTDEIITSPDTEVYKVLADTAQGLPSNLPDTLRLFRQSPSLLKEKGVPPYLASIVSSQLDGDRFDYLLRDSHCTGAQYGKFDVDWLIHSLQVNEERDRLELNKKGLAAAEGYIFARHHMYQAVYFHKTTRAAEVMLRLLFRRFETLLTADSNFALLGPGIPYRLASAFTTEGGARTKIKLHDYLELDDHSVSELCHALSQGRDPILGSLASGLVQRKLYKAIDLTGRETETDDFLRDLQQVTDTGALGFELSEHKDTPADVPYKPYDEDADRPETQIFVEGNEGKPINLARASEPIKSIEKKYKSLRYYFPEKVKQSLPAKWR